MKIQDLAIIFIIIIIPISLVLSVYTQFQMKTINMQSLYDSKLTSATYDAIKAFQLNSANESFSDISTEKLRGLEASITTFKNSLKSTFELNGYTEQELNNYIPALVYTLYDGLYIYSPYENTNHRYENAEGTMVTDPSLEGYTKADENGEKLYGLKPYINYSCRYKSNDVDVVITYALDNYIKVQGMVGNEYVNKSGYLIDNIEVDGNDVTYNGVNIGKEHLKENIGGNLYSYIKENGIKYYLVGDQIKNFFNGSFQDVTDPTRVKYLKNIIMNNNSAQQYYKEAKAFSDWFKKTVLVDLKYENAYDEVIDSDGNVKIDKIWNGDTRNIFDFNDADEIKNNIENQTSEFNQHRTAVIRHKIETNLAIAISNYNTYSGAINEFQMPELKEDEWEYLINNIAVISFLQGLPISGKTYNGYSIVTNSESKEVVLEENIYILGKDSSGNTTYHRIGDIGIEDSSTISINDGEYGVYQDSTDSISAGRLNLDFKRTSITDNNGISRYYYPLKDYNASYDSIVMQNNVTTYDDIYEYVSEQSIELKEAFYTGLARERKAMYRTNNETINRYSVLMIGYANPNYIYWDTKERNTNEFVNMLNEVEGINATSIFSSDKTEIKDTLQREKSNYNLIILHSYAWQLQVSSAILSEVASETNLITISDDAIGLPMMKSGRSGVSDIVVTSQQTDLGNEILGDIPPLSKNRSTSQAIIKFNDDVEILYTGKYTNKSTNEIIDNGDLVGCWKNGEHKWIHSQISLESTFSYDEALFKELVEYGLNIN